MYRSNHGFIRSLFLDGEGNPNPDGGAPPPEVFQYQHGDATIDIPVTALKPVIDKVIGDKYVPKASHNDQMARLRREADQYKTRPTADDLLNDTEFKTRATQHWGLDPKATNKEIQDQRERLRNEIFEREVKPRDAKISIADSTIKELRLKDLRGQIAQAANTVKVDDKFTKQPSKNGQSLIVSMMLENFEWDDEHKEWFAKGSGGNRFAFSQTGEVPYMTVSEYFQVWANAEGKDFLRNERQKGAESEPERGGAPTGQVGRELRLTAEQIRNIPFFKQMQEKATKEGLTIVPV